MLQTNIYFCAKTSVWFSSSLDDLWFFDFFHHNDLEIKLQSTRNSIRWRNILILFSIFLITLNVLRIILLIILGFLFLLVPRAIDCFFSFIGLLGVLYLNFYCQFLFLFVSFLIEIEFCVLFYLEYSKKSNLWQVHLILWTQLIDIVILLPFTYLLFKMLDWYNVSIKQRNNKRWHDLVEELSSQKIQKKQQLNLKKEKEIITKSDISEEEKEITLTKKELCIVCLALERDAIFYKCGHNCCCMNCAKNFQLNNRCPICRAIIKDVVKINLN